ncbi:MAG: hypothetical protein IPJ68_00350 [Candidatus Moraniibacteriota bacterium]|nr:MAG: hypothetical protein IPJ68_00350 [Candidatus Moranbacteria bacterium]
MEQQDQSSETNETSMGTDNIEADAGEKKIQYRPTVVLIALIPICIFGLFCSILVGAGVGAHLMSDFLIVLGLPVLVMSIGIVVIGHLWGRAR